MISTLDVKLHALNPGSTAMSANATRWLGAHCELQLSLSLRGAFVWDADGKLKPTSAGHVSNACCHQQTCSMIITSVLFAFARRLLNVYTD
jgi:hypothetical protein